MCVKRVTKCAEWVTFCAMLAVHRLAQFVVGFGVLVVTFCVTFRLSHSPLFRLFSPMIPVGYGFLSHLARVMHCIEAKGGNGRSVDSLKIERGCTYYREPQP